jgi:hypothetical protein
MKWLAASALVLVAAGCSKSDDPGRSADSAGIVPVAATPPVRVDSTRPLRRDACPATGKWALCNLETRLKRAGFVAKRVEGKPAKRAGFTVTPAVYTLGHGRLEVFLYDDEASLVEDLVGLDTVAVAPTGAAGAWPSTPGFVRSGNLAAVFMDQSARQVERLVLAITAGAPSGR